MKRVIGCILIVIFCLISGSVTVHCSQPASSRQVQRVVKVGYPIQSSLTMKDEKGNYYGYMYDYLKELSLYTGWTYEFVEVPNEDIDTQITKLLEMLENGEIDMLGSMRYSEQLAKMYDYPTESYGNAYSVLAVLDNNDKLDSYTLGSTKELKVALSRTAVSRNEKWKQYAQNNGIHYTELYYDDIYKQSEAVRNGEADCWIAIDIGLEQEFRAIARFSADPMYFAVTKGNSDIIHELNKGMEQLNEINPTLVQTLYQKYFEQKSQNVILTEQEKTYIENSDELTVLVLKDQAPIQFINGEPKGVSVDILNKVSEKTGLKFKYESVETYEEYIEKVSSSSAQLLAGINYDYSMNNAFPIDVTTSYVQAPLQMILREQTDIENLSQKRIAIRRELSVVLEDRINEENVLYCNSTRDCIQAVEDGKADYCIDSTYAISYYMNKGNYQSLISVADGSQLKLNYSFGVAHSDDHLLVGIINKCIRTLSEEDIHAFVFQHSTEKGEFSLVQYIQQHVVETAIVVIMTIMSIIGCFSYFYHRQSKMKRQIEIENSRYRMLGKITEEVIFEYDYVKDILNLSGKQNILSANREIKDYSQSVEEDKSLLDCIMEKKDTDQEVLLVLGSGEKRWYHIVMKVVYDLDKPVYAIGRAIDIQEERLEREKLEKESTTDALTGIYNASTIKKLIQEWLNSHHEGFAFGILDLDYFKNINDEYGHFIGDQVLTLCAKKMCESFGDKSLLGRLGGDEFIIFLPYCIDKQTIEKKCLSMQQKMEEDFNDLPLTTVSIGFVVGTGNEDFNVLYQYADKLLYEVKKKGRDAYKVVEWL